MIEERAKLSLADAFDMGCEWGRGLNGQTMEDSRAVGRTLYSETFAPIADAIDREIQQQGFNSFACAENGIFEAKKIIRAALSDAGLVETVERLRKYIAEYEDAPTWGGPTMYPARPSIADLKALLAALTPNDDHCGSGNGEEGHE